MAIEGPAVRIESLRKAFDVPLREPGLMLALLIVSRFVWRRGLRRFGGASA
ncbi:MAG: hypothetical protein JWN39_3769 [Ilumatobacteraceae bacterium]|nr:hypothetical protein [Ilumatobacteraceae bacterium]